MFLFSTIWKVCVRCIIFLANACKKYTNEIIWARSCPLLLWYVGVLVWRKFFNCSFNFFRTKCSSEIWGFSSLTVIYFLINPIVVKQSYCGHYMNSILWSLCRLAFLLSIMPVLVNIPNTLENTTYSVVFWCSFGA